jgi:hypothetical protein
MSYSFSVSAPSKDEAKTKVRDELVRVTTAQPVHALDSDQAFEAVAAFIELLHDDPTRDVSASISGSISTTDQNVTHANVNVTVQLAARA